MKKLKNKILYIFDESDCESRLPVAIQAQKEGFDVTLGLISSNEIENQSPELKEQLSKFPITPIYTNQTKSRVSPLKLLALVKKIKKIIADTKPDLLHTVTLKYAFICGLSTLSYKTGQLKRLYTLAGLGYLFRSSQTKATLLRSLLSPLLKKILKHKDAHIIFQNPDDLSLFLEKGFSQESKSILIKGSGVNLNKFTPTQEPSIKPPLVLMPTRLVEEKGIHIFVHAAQLLKEKNIDARFQIAGGETKDNPKAISTEQMQAMCSNGVVEWLGRIEDMPQLLSRANIIVYPSYYGEGIPRVLLEACASARAIITTNHPGCKEAVSHEQNGLLIPIKDAQACASAMENLLSNDNKRNEMGKNSRKKAEKEFDILHIAIQTTQAYKKALIS